VIVNLVFQSNLKNSKLAIHVFQLHDDGPATEELEEDIAAANHWLLPCGIHHSQPLTVLICVLFRVNVICELLEEGNDWLVLLAHTVGFLVFHHFERGGNTTQNIVSKHNLPENFPEWLGLRPRQKFE